MCVYEGSSRNCEGTFKEKEALSRRGKPNECTWGSLCLRKNQICFKGLFRDPHPVFKAVVKERVGKNVGKESGPPFCLRGFKRGFLNVGKESEPTFCLRGFRRGFL